MDNIRDITTQIRKAAYGKDVRENIALGIEKISDREDTFEQLINTSEVTRQNNENTRKTNETSRVDNENTRKTDEIARHDAEELRKTNEIIRHDNEEIRKTNEITRHDNEEIRKTDEVSRQNSETLRQTNENSRITEETIRENNEDIRIGNEDIRNTNEIARMHNEDVRDTSEITRVDNENTRKSNETIRLNQESSRQSNELTRQNQETTRQDNETLRQETINSLKINEPYNPDHDYKPLNKVTYDGSSFMNIVACKGILPTNTANWICIATKGLDGTGAGDMVKSRYDTDDDGIVDHAEVADSVEWLGVKNSPTFAEKTYVDDQLQTIVSTGVPKFVSYTYEYIATEGQTKFVIPYEHLDHPNDKVDVKLDGYDVPTSFYTITNPVENPDTTITKGYITTNVGRPKDSFVKIIISKNVPIGPEGAISGSVLAVDSIPQNRVQGLIELQNDVKKTNGTVIPEVAYGMNNKITNATKTSVSPKFTIHGKTVINLLGKDGNCENPSKWTASGCTLSLDSANKLYGSNGIKVTGTTVNAPCYAGRSSPINLKQNSYYFMRGAVKCDTDGGFNFGIGTAMSGAIGGGATGLLTKNTKLSEIGLKFQATQSDITNMYAWVYFYASSGVVSTGSMDGIGIYEIYADDYNNLTTSQLLAKYPYVDSYSCLQNPYIEIRHDNLVRNGNGEEGIAWWTPFNSSVIVSIVNGKIRVNSTTSGAIGCGQVVNVKQNTDYYLSGNATIGNVDGNIQIWALGYTSNILSSKGTFNSGSNTQVIVYIRPSATGYADFDSITLIEGTTPPTQYKPCRIERTVIEGKFTSEDRLTYQNGEVTGLINWKHRTLYGKDYDWQFNSDLTGFKSLYVINPFRNYIPYPNGGFVGVKFDGRIESYDSTTTKSDAMNIGGSGNINLSVLDSDTGWTEAINPNNDEVKAFMNGWKAINVYGTRYNLFVSVVDGSIPSGATISNITTGGTTTFIVADGSKYAINDAVYFFRNGVYFGGSIVSSISGNTITVNSAVNTQAGDICVRGDVPPTNTSLLTWCKNNVAPNYEGYQLHYKLANPEPITDVNTNIHGDIPKFDVGDNYLYLDSGMVLGEVANPKDNTQGWYVIYENKTVPWYSPLRYSEEKHIAVYKNEAYDDKFIINNSNATDSCFAQILSANYDANATYTVDYKILSTIAPQIGSIGCSYSQDIVSAINNLNEVVENKQNHDSILDNIIDLSLYERFDTYSVGPLIPWINNYGSIFVQYTIPITPKKLKGTITILECSLLTSINGVNAIDIFNISTVHSITQLNNQICIIMRINDPTTINYIKTYGIQGSVRGYVDCRGRI